MARRWRGFLPSSSSASLISLANQLRSSFFQGRKVEPPLILISFADEVFTKRDGFIKVIKGATCRNYLGYDLPLFDKKKLWERYGKIKWHPLLKGAEKSRSISALRQ